MASSLSDSIERFSKTNWRIKGPVIAGIMLLLGAVYYFLLHSDLEDRASQAQSALVELEGERDKYIERKQTYRALRLRVEQKRELDRREQRLLPDSANIATTFQQAIHSQAELTGVRIDTIDAQREIRRGFYAEIPVKMKVTGTYHQLAKFFYYLEKDARASDAKQARRLVRINDLQLGAPKTTDQGVLLQADFVASTFRYLRPKRPARQG